jgi:hypothetical protein
MPFYTIHCSHGSWTKKGEQFSEKLAHLHAQTFGTDWRAVRIEYLVTHPNELSIKRAVSPYFPTSPK